MGRTGGGPGQGVSPVCGPAARPQQARRPVAPAALRPAWRLKAPPAAAWRPPGRPISQAVPAERAAELARDSYACPVYSTPARFRQEVFTAQLRSRSPWTKWAAAGVALFLDGA